MLGQVAGFLDAVGRVQNVQRTFAALQVLGATLGFDEVLLGRYRPNPGTGELRPAEFAATDPEGVRRYVSQMSDDSETLLPLRAVQPKLLRVERAWLARNAASRELAEDPYVWASAIRVKMPVTRTPDGGAWHVSFGGTDHVCNPRDAAAMAPALWLAAALAGARLAAVDPGGAAEIRLTPRERECLTRLTAGDRVDRIAERLGLSNATVELHLANARRRLGARTSAEAVAKAVLLGLVRP